MEQFLAGRRSIVQGKRAKGGEGDQKTEKEGKRSIVGTDGEKQRRPKEQREKRR